MDRRIIVASAVAAGVGLQAFSYFEPSVAQVRWEPTRDQPDKRDAVRAGLVFATITAAAVCLMIAIFNGHPAPFIVGIVTAAAMVGTYEWALR